MEGTQGQEYYEQSEDIAQLLSVLHVARSDNAELKRNFESLKELHLQLSEDHKQLQARYSSLYDERVTVERQYQALCESWRLELEDKQKQFEHVKAQILGPRDLELMRLAMMEKVELPYRTKCELLAKEAEAAQVNFVRQRREYEELQSAYRSLELQSQRDTEALVAEHTSIVMDLKDRLAAMAANQAKLAQAEFRAKAAEREKAELSFQLTRLREEIQELRVAKEQENVARGTVQLRVERKVKAIQAEELQMAGLVETLTRKNRHLQKELAEAHRSNEEMFEQRMRMQTMQASLQSQLDSLAKQMAADAAAQEEQHLAAARSLEDKVLALRDELHSKERQISELHISHQEQITAVVESHSQRVEELEQEHARRTRELRELNVELTARVETLKDTLEECRHDLAEAQHKLKRDQDTGSRQAERLQAQLAEAQQQVTARDTELSQIKKELEGLKGDVMRLELSRGKLLAQKEELESLKGRLDDDSQQQSAARLSLAKANEELQQQLMAEREAHLDQAEQQRQSFAVEKSSLAKRYQAAIKELNAKHELEIKRLRQKLKAVEQSAARLAQDLTEMRLRPREIESQLAHYDSAQARGARGGVRALTLEGAGPAEALGGLPRRSENIALLKDIADLQLRQNEYLKGAA